MSTDSLPIFLRGLGLTTIVREHEAAITRAEADNWGYRRFLQHLVETETNERLTRRIERLVKESGLPASETLARLAPEKFPDKARRLLPTLRTGEFMRRGDAICVFGLPGTGKSAYVCALCRDLVEQHQLKVLFLSAFKLVTRLLAAKRDLALPALLTKLNRYDAIIIDDISYITQSIEENDVLFALFAERYEQHKSVIVTSNLVPSQWDQIFKNPMTAAAIIDRLVHRGYQLEFTGESFRAQAAKARRS
jgi:DNA replication protein DnaC